MARPFKHKRPAKPERDRIVFLLLRAMAGHKTADISRGSWVASSTISKIRTRRTRYPTNITIQGILRAVGATQKFYDKDGNEIE